jgi:gas vesicle protein
MPSQNKSLLNGHIKRDLQMTQINSKHAAGYLLAGAMVGAAVALAFAPQSGARTTKSIRNFARKSRYRVTDWVSDMTDIIKEGIEQGKELGADGYDQMLRGLDSAKVAVEEGKSRLQQLVRPT